MSVVIAAGDGRWPLQHGQDPADLLAGHGLAGEPRHATLDAQGRIEIHFAGTPLEAPVPPVPVGPTADGAWVHQRVGAYAVVVDDDRLLMSRLAGWVPGAAGLWALPGGGIEVGEQPLDAVVRECLEETGQHVVVDDLVQVQSQHWHEAGPDGTEDFHALRLVYRAHCPRPTSARVVEVDGSTGEAAWVPLERVDALPLTGMVPLAVPLARR